MNNDFKPRFSYLLIISFLISIFVIAGIIEEKISGNEFSAPTYGILDLITTVLVFNLGSMSIVFSVVSFHFLFGLRHTLIKIILGIVLLVLDAELIPRYYQVTSLQHVFFATLFIVLATVFILSYIRLKKKILIFASFCIILFGIFQISKGPPIEPFYQIIFGLNLLTDGTKSNIFLELLSALSWNVGIAMIYGYLTGELVLGNVYAGKYYSTQGNRILKIIFLVSQTVFIIYLIFLYYKKGISSAPFLNQDPFYLIFDSVSTFFMSIYVVTEIKNKLHEKWDILRLVFLVIGTGFLIPATYPAIDAIFRMSTLAGFLVRIKK